MYEVIFRSQNYFQPSHPISNNNPVTKLLHSHVLEMPPKHRRAKTPGFNKHLFVFILNTSSLSRALVFPVVTSFFFLTLNHRIIMAGKDL